VTTEPLTLAEAARHLRVESDDPGYSDLGAYVTAARQTVEQYLNASVAVQTRTLIRDAFPGGDGTIVLPDGPVLSVTTIAYVDTDGANQTVAAHRLVNYPYADVLEPAYGASWPSTRNQRGAVTITYQAGMMAGSPLTLANEDIKSGVKLVLGDLWQNREAQIIGTIVAVNATVDRLLYPYRRAVGI
jgi:uncharacterized phiE125 gp8 family phage protein